MFKSSKLWPLLISLYTLPAQSSTLSDMNTLQPRINHTEVARLIDVYAAKYRINPRIIVALAFQESGLNHRNHRIHNGRVTDRGLMQLNEHTISQRGLDIARLDSDLDYYMHHAIKFLSEKITMCAAQEYPYLCWHSRTPKHAQKYLQLVSRHLRRLEEKPGAQKYTTSTSSTRKLLTTTNICFRTLKVRTGARKCVSKPDFARIITSSI